MFEDLMRERHPDVIYKRPSKIFGERLREIRDARGFTQAQLAELMTGCGTRMNKVSLLEIEKGTRGLLLDEALAFAAVLNAVPAHMLTPPEGEWIHVSDNHVMDGAALRGFLRHGFPWYIEPKPDAERGDSTPGDVKRERQRETFQLNLARVALALVDARRGGDNEGVVDAVDALVAEVLRREREKEAQQ